MVMSPSPILAVGEFGNSRRRQLDEAASAARFELQLADSARAAGGFLTERHPRAMLVDPEQAEARQAALEVRASPAHAQLPIVALTEQPADLGFADVFSWGGDDLVGYGRPRHLIARLRILPHEEPGAMQAGTATALVADSDAARRLALGRVLRNAGYAVSFAAAAGDVSERTAIDRPNLIVASSELADDPNAAVAAAEALGVSATWIITVPPRELRARRESLVNLPHASATDGFAPPENVLFLANEMKSAGGANHRASRRLLYGTTVLFRGAGRDEDDFGFTYNVSRGGLYVRTLAPPDDDLVWLELTPPRAERRVRLVGKVAWRRRFGPNERATVPPGFGVQVVDGAKLDLDAWEDGYDAFCDAVG